MQKNISSELENEEKQRVVRKQKVQKCKKNKKKTSIIAITLILSISLVLFLTLYVVAGSVFFKFALDATFEVVLNTPNNMVEEMPLPNTNPSWFNEIPKTIEEIKSADDGYQLRAYQILNNNNNHNWIITIHGYRGNARDMSDYAYHFYNYGFNVLMPDLEGHGLSEGRYIGMGYTDRNDVLKWIDFIIEKDPEAKIVLHGVSMGGATVMMTTGEALPPNVKCAIEDCGYSNVHDQFKYMAEVFLDLPFSKILLSSVDFISRIKTHISLKKVSCVNQLKKSTTPTLFIHGDDDTFVPYSMLDIVYNANPNLEKEKLVVEGASHAYSATLNPTLYFGKIFEFVEKYI